MLSSFLLLVTASSAATAVSSTELLHPKWSGSMTLGSQCQSSNRRWEALTDNCIGCWSGAIGWYDVKVTDNDGTQIQYELESRPDNNKRNMRLSFQTREDDASIADWMVYHAKGWGVKEEVVLREDAKGDSDMQTFYSFQGGNLGRSGSDFTKLPVIEHGFWDVTSDGLGTRRTVVLVYSPQNGHLTKVCYPQQEKVMGNKEFDVSGISRKDIGIMPKKSPMCLDRIRKRWCRSPTMEYMEELDVAKYRYKCRHECEDQACSVLSGLLGSHECNDDDNLMRLSLPNGVVIACPLCFKPKNGNKSFDVSMGFRNRYGNVQFVGFNFDSTAKLIEVHGGILVV